MRKLLSSIIAAAMVLVLAFPVCAAPAPVPANPGSLDWNAKYLAAKKLVAIESPRDNASGDKITSNAHSADYPGLYFYWNEKQKDDGVLLVADWVFGLFEGNQFILTAKNSNAYWGYVITQDVGQLIDGVYAYGIPRNFMYADKKGKLVNEELKNINHIGIPNGTYKDDGPWQNNPAGLLLLLDIAYGK